MRNLLVPNGRLPLILLVLVGLMLIAAPRRVAAQTPEDAMQQQLDQIAGNLQNIETALQNRGLTDEQLQAETDRVTPLASVLEAAIGRLAPRLAELKTRLEQLGPAPDPKAAPGDPKVTADRVEQQKTHDSVDALLKRAKLLAVQADQTQTQISARRRALFTHSLFERSPSLISPKFWLPLAEELPRDIQSARNLAIDFYGNFSARLTGPNLAAFLGLCALVVALCWPLGRMGQWVLMRESSIVEPGRFRRFLTAWWIAFVIASLPIAATFAIGWIFQTFDLITWQVQTFAMALAIGIATIALTAGLGRGLLSPEHANWRLIRLPDTASSTILNLAMAIATIFAATRIGEAVIETTGGSANMQTAIRGAGAGLIALVIIAGLWRYGARSDKSEDVFGPRVAISSDWFGSLRVVLWIAASAIVVSTIAGFFVLAGFIAEQIVWVTGVILIAFMASGLVDAGIVAGCRPTAPFGRSLAGIVGLSAQSLGQLGILISGVVRAVAFIIAWLLILAPWGIRSTDVPGYFRAAFFGFKIDDFKVSLAAIGAALAIFLGGYVITRRIVQWLDATYLPMTSMDVGLRNAIKTSLGYVGVSITVLISLAYIGLSFEKLAIVASALSIGIGFGLQSIVNNFVSGLIILWEGAIRVGDWIIVGADEGFVRRINVRSTEIETFDHASVIIPNSNMVTGVVKNFVRTDRVGRIKITVDVDLSADPDTVRDALYAIARNHELVLEKPAAFVTFEGFDSSHLHFQMYCFVADVTTLAKIRSDLTFEIFKKFRPAGWLAGPPPSSVVTLAGLERFEPLLQKMIIATDRDGLGNVKETG